VGTPGAHEKRILLTNPNSLGYSVPAMNNAVKKYLAEIGKKGGSATSAAKAAAARKNGKKGGRPRKDGKQ